MLYFQKLLLVWSPLAGRGAGLSVLLGPYPAILSLISTRSCPSSMDTRSLLSLPAVICSRIPCQSLRAAGGPIGSVKECRNKCGVSHLKVNGYDAWEGVAHTARGWWHPLVMLLTWFQATLILKAGLQAGVFLLLTFTTGCPPSRWVLSEGRSHLAPNLCVIWSLALCSYLCDLCDG